jgi:hypothetical protein
MVKENPCISNDVNTLPSIILSTLYVENDLKTDLKIIPTYIYEHPPRLFTSIIIFFDFKAF